MSTNGTLLNPAEFTQAAAHMLAAYPEVEVVQIEDLSLGLRVRGREVSSELQNFYNLYLGSPDQLQTIWQALSDALLDQPPDRTEDDPAVLMERALPMLKPLALLEQVRSQNIPMLAYRPLMGDLMITYVIDEGQRAAFINEDHLARWNVTEPMLYAHAIYNLRTKPWTPKPGLLGTGANALLIFNGTDGYDATRLLMPELFTDFAAQIPGNLVIGVPNRDFLIAFSDADPSIFDRVRLQIETDAQTQTNPLSPQLWTYHNSQLAPYDGT